jgi:hypothetical protein
VSTEHTWLDLVPPLGATPTEFGPDSRLGDAIAVTRDELRQLNRLPGMSQHDHPDDLRQRVCRTLGPQRVTTILQNYERGLNTLVVVEP